MGKSTISIAIFNSKLLNYQRVPIISHQFWAIGSVETKSLGALPIQPLCWRPSRTNSSIGIWKSYTNTKSAWWYTYPSEKYAKVSWDKHIPNIWKNNSQVPNHQPENVQLPSGNLT
jgi:hypothetical protein